MNGNLADRAMQFDCRSLAILADAAFVLDCSLFLNLGHTVMTQTIHHQIVIVGGGTAGITVAAQLTKGWFNKLDVAVIELSDKHYYQPL